MARYAAIFGALLVAKIFFVMTLAVIKLEEITDM